MAKANSEYGNNPFEMSDGIQSDSGVVWSSGARAENEPFRCQVPDSLWSDFIVPKDADFGSKPFQILNEVVGEGIVVVDEYDHVRLSPISGGSPLSFARSRAKLFPNPTPRVSGDKPPTRCFRAPGLVRTQHSKPFL